MSEMIKCLLINFTFDRVVDVGQSFLKDKLTFEKVFAGIEFRHSLKKHKASVKWSGLYSTGK